MWTRTELSNARGKLNNGFKETSRAGNGCSRFRPLWCQPLTERWQVKWHPSWQTKNPVRKRNGKTWYLKLRHMVSMAVYRLAGDSRAQVCRQWVSSSLMINDTGQSMTWRINTHEDLEAVIPLDWELFHIVTCGKVNLTIQFWSLRKKNRTTNNNKTPC